VNLADLEDNMDIRRRATPTDRDAERLRRYLAAWRVLSAAAQADRVESRLALV